MVICVSLQACAGPGIPPDGLTVHPNLPPHLPTCRRAAAARAVRPGPAVCAAGGGVHAQRAGGRAEMLAGVGLGWSQPAGGKRLCGVLWRRLCACVPVVRVITA